MPKSNSVRKPRKGVNTARNRRRDQREADRLRVYVTPAGRQIVMTGRVPDMTRDEARDLVESQHPGATVAPFDQELDARFDNDVRLRIVRGLRKYRRGDPSELGKVAATATNCYA